MSVTTKQPVSTSGRDIRPLERGVLLGVVAILIAYCGLLIYGTYRAIEQRLAGIALIQLPISSELAPRAPTTGTAHVTSVDVPSVNALLTGISPGLRFWLVVDTALATLVLLAIAGAILYLCRQLLAGERFVPHDPYYSVSGVPQFTGGYLLAGLAVTVVAFAFRVGTRLSRDTEGLV